MLLALRWASGRWGPRRVALVAGAALTVWLAFALLAPDPASAGPGDWWDPRTYFDALRDFGSTLKDVPGLKVVAEPKLTIEFGR